MKAEKEERDFEQKVAKTAKEIVRKPDWLKVRIGSGPGYARMSGILREGNLHTVCQEAMCPNIGRCWESGRATVMILGGTCTRTCGFCAVSSGWPRGCDSDEPARVAKAVKAMELKDVVITSVTRDDLADGGAGIWRETIRLVRKAVPRVRVEALVPDFGGSPESLLAVLRARPQILGHNLETVPSLYGTVRPQADYRRSLEVLRRAHIQGVVTKTSIMVGMGEKAEEIMDVMRDALRAGCDIFFMGQYLQPTKKHLPVDRFVEPREFEMYRRKGLQMGFKVVASAPLVRSSYYSEEQDRFMKARKRKR